MRILHAVHDYLPDQVAGVEVYTNRVAECLAAQHAVGILYATLASDRETGFVEATGESSFRRYALTQRRDWTRFQQTWDDPRVVSGIAGVLDEFAPDIVHLQHLMNLGMAWLDEVERREIPTVMTLHDQWWACAAGGQRFRSSRERCDDLDADRCATCTATSVGPALALRGRRQRRAARERKAAVHGNEAAQRGTRIRGRQVGEALWSGLVGLTGSAHIEERWASMRRLGDRIDAFIAPSSEIREAAIDFGFPSDRIIYLPHGMPHPGGDVSPLPDTFLRFGYIGSLVPHKGVHHLIEAFGRLPAEASLDVYGSLEDAPDYVAELRGLIRHPGVRLRGERAPKEVPALLDRLDVLVAPSLWRENAPLTVQEAFVAGRPVIASKLGGHVELLTTGGGLLFEPGDVDSLAEAMLRLVRESGLGRRLASTIPKVRTLEAHVEDLGAIYQRMLDRRKRVSASPGPDRGVLFLDRDGVINHDSSDFIRSAADWVPLPGSLEAIARLSRAGYRIAVVTNQSGLARELFAPSDLAEIHARLEASVSALGGRIEGIWHCAHGPDDGCACRKPGTGLIDEARRALGVDVAGAPFVGDRETDLRAARAAGCRPVFVRSGRGREADLSHEWRDVPRFDDLAAVADRLLGESTSSPPGPAADRIPGRARAGGDASRGR